MSISESSDLERQNVVEDTGRDRCPKPGQNFDYIETNFRYMAIGSPVPCLDHTENSAENQYDADLEPDSAAEDDSKLRKRNKKAFFGHDFDSHKLDQKSPVRRRKKKTQEKDKHPAIKVEQCETDSPQIESDDDNESDSSGGRSSSHNDVYSLNSTPQAQFFLSPTPPLSRKCNVDSKAVVFYTPSLTSSKSEGCLIENIQNESCSSQNGPDGISSAHSLGVLLSTPNADVSFANRNVQIAPI